MKIKKETDLFPHIKQYFEKEGYQVNAEVASFDVVLSKTIDEQIQVIIIECKLSFNISLVFQAMEAQRVADFVYMAVPVVPDKKLHKIIHLAKNMGLGLILVAETGRPIIAVTEQDVEAYQAYRIKVKRDRIEKEISTRRFDKNIGGSTKTKILTAFKEKSVQIAIMLEDGEKNTTTLIKKYNCPKETTQILYTNRLGWFQRMGRASYKLTRLANTSLKDPMYQEIVEFYRHEKKVLDKK